jgi:hypothetical protein
MRCQLPFLMLGFIAVLAVGPACGTSSTPTSPTGGIPATATYTISGIVTVQTAAGLEPVQGTEVRETLTLIGATTGADGRYSLPGVPQGDRAVRVTKEGLVTKTSRVLVGADTQLDLVMDRVGSYILSGVVYEVTAAGRVAVEGVDVYCDSCGSPVGHTAVFTDANGVYSLSWSSNGLHVLLIRKAGYALPQPTVRYNGGLEGVTATVNGDTRFDIELVRR